MKKNIKALLVLALVGLLQTSNVNADTIVFEDFEDSTITYSSSDPDDLSDIGALDYYGRIASDTSTPATVIFSNTQGTGYYGVQDSDSATTARSTVELLWNTIDTSNFSDLSLSWFIGEDDSTDGNQDWDSDTSFRVEIDLDGAGFMTVFQVESEDVAGDQTNERPLVDTDFDGVGDGAEITDTMTQYSVLLADANTVSVRVVFEQMNAGDEDMAFDSFHLEGISTVPEPGTAGLLGIAFVGLICSRRRKT